MLRAIETLRGMALPLIIVLVSRRSFADLIGFVIIGGVLVVSIASRAIAWMRLSYAVTDQGVWMRSGLVERRERFLPFERIQSVNISENLLHRLFGVVRMSIESAAGGQQASDIVLDAMDRRTAESLRAHIARMQGRGAMAPPDAMTGVVPAGADAATVEGELIRRVSPGELVIAGAVSGSIGPLAALAGGAIQFADDLLPASVAERIAVSASGLHLRGIVLLIALVAMIAWLLSIGSTLIRFWGFELRQSGDRLLVSHGLLDRRRVSVPLSRIQALTITEGLLAQPLGRGALHDTSAGEGRTSAESGVLLPVIARAEIERLLPRIHARLGIATRDLPFERLPGRALRRYLMAPTWGVLFMTAAACVVLALWVHVSWRWGLLGLLLTPVTVLFGLAQFRSTGWWVGLEGELVSVSRPIHRATMITIRQRLQMRELASDPLQRRADLATFAAAVPGAGGGIRIEHLDREDGRRLVERLSPRPETTSGSASAPYTGSEPTQPLPPHPPMPSPVSS